MRNRLWYAILLSAPVLSFGLPATQTPLKSSPVILSLYRSALTHDEQYLSAVAQYQEQRATSSKAYAAILPQLWVSGDISNRRTDSLTHNLSVNGEQTLFNWQDFLKIKQSRIETKQALSALLASQQDLLFRVCTAYTHVAQENSIYQATKEQQQAMSDQVHAVRQRYHARHATITELDRVKGARDLYRAETITAQINVDQSIEQLNLISGMRIRKIPVFSKRFSMITPKQTKISAWTQSMVTHNFNFIAAIQQVHAIQQAVNGSYGAFLPSVSAYGTYYPNKPPWIDKKMNYGLSLNFNPLKGGAAFSDVSYAKAQLQLAKTRERGLYRTLQQQIVSSLHNTIFGIKLIRSQKQAVASNLRALKDTKQGYFAGSQTILDVLDQQQMLYQAMIALAQGKFNYVSNMLTLNYSSGQLTPEKSAYLKHWIRT